ncbi:MAG: outer membrane protein transport protein [Bdellovibrionales bacterium]|nr:outer membrane protein transport protein [Bdellovibrionales bacterium]
MSLKAIRICAVAVLFSFAASPMAMGAGFEKTINWSGRWNGVAGAGTAGASGGEALFFNPAGLSAGKKHDFSANFSPTQSYFFGQISTSTTGAGASILDQSSTHQFSPIFGAVGSYKLNEKLGIGVGAYVGGGSKVLFENVGGRDLMDFKTDISLTEFAAGVGYEWMPGLRVGAAYRVSMAKAALTQGADLAPAGIATGLSQVRMENFSQTTFDGFRLGAQYEGKGWGVGVSYRSKTKLEGSVDQTLQVNTVGGGAVLNGTSITKSGTLSTQLPQQLNVGGWFDVTSTLKTFVEYNLTNYKAVNKIGTATTMVAADGSTLGAGAGTAVASGTVTSLNNGIETLWNNQHVARIGFEYTGCTNYAIRLGYAYTSQVVPANRAKATFSSPGTANSFTLGVGRNLGENMMVNLAGELARAEGTVAASDASLAVPAGLYKTQAVAAHVGLTYMF